MISILQDGLSIPYGPIPCDEQWSPNDAVVRSDPVPFLFVDGESGTGPLFPTREVKGKKGNRGENRGILEGVEKEYYREK